jgi:hypothetical protein
VATFLAITVPTATVIMAVDHFLLPRLFRISRPLTQVPSWEETGLINVPAVLALLAAVFFGVTGTANWPHGWIYSTPQNGWGPVPVWSWLIGGALYVGLVALVRGTSRVRTWLGFAKTVPDEAIPTEAVSDVGSLAGA